MLRDERRPGDYLGGEKVLDLLDVLGAIKTDALLEYLGRIYNGQAGRQLLRFLHGRGYIINSEQDGYVYANVKSEASYFSDILFAVFSKLSKSKEDRIDLSRYPFAAQMYLDGKIYHIISLEEGGREKLRYRYSLPSALTEEEDVVLVLISVNHHQEAKFLLRDNMDLLPESLLWVKVTVDEKPKIDITTWEKEA